ncbi:MAG: TonB-dependent receptor [Bryobacteraceae bacterium]
MKQIAVFLFAAISVFAQAPGGSGIAGAVIDPSGAAVPQAVIRLFTRDSTFQQTTTTGAEGRFRFDRLPPAEYLLEARTDTLDQASPVTVRVEAGRLTEVELKLEIRGLATQVQVTAAVTPQSTVESGKALDIVDAAMLERRAEILLSEAVRLVPGLRVQQLGGPGSFTRIQMRGLRAADTGVLIDGMRLRDSASVQGDATAFLGDMQLIQTDRVEILRGLGSSIYGTNATAGVLNLVTDSGGGRTRGEIGGEGGGLGLARGLAKIAGETANSRLHYSAGIAHLNVNGGVDGVESVRNSSAQGQLLWRPTATSSLSGRLWSTLSTVGVNSSPFAAPASNLPATIVIRAIPLAREQALLGDRGLPFEWGNATFAPNFFDPDSRREGRFVTTLVQWAQQAAPRFHYRLSYQNVDTHRDNRNGPGGQGYQPRFNSSSLFAGRIDTVQARADVAAARWNALSAGLEWEREFYENPSADENPDPAQRVNARASAHQRSLAVFVQDQLRLLHERLQIGLTGRYQTFQLSRPKFEGGFPLYENAPFTAPPDALTGDAAISYFLPKANTKLRAHAGNGFRAPTLYERIGSSFFWGAFSPLGDPQLRPERTVSFDFGVDRYFAGSRYRLSSTYFYTRLQEVIGYSGLVNDPYGRWGGYVNMGGGLTRGVELVAEARPRRSLMVTTSYTYTNADERRSALIGGSLRSIRVFPHMFTLTASQQVTRRWQVTADFLGASDYVSGSFFVGSGSRPYEFPGPRKLDLAGSYSLPVDETRTLRFYVRAENVLNQRYFEDGFRTPRAWATAGLKLLF